MRRVFLILKVILMILTSSCGGGAAKERLAYQNSPLYVEGKFTLGQSSFDAKLTLEPPEYDENGRMLAREAMLSFGDEGILSGISFEFIDGDAYVCAEDMRIPIADKQTVSGISDIISLFCISQEFYYQSEKLEINKLECERDVYVNGEDRVEVIIDLSCELPISITATVGGRSIAVDISLIKAE